MLQVHPDSTCDVCLDQYTFSNTSKTPHAIACGHIFCLECLAHLNHPTSCPLCRKNFFMDHVKKLHVDRHVPGDREAAMPAAWDLVQRLARCARSESPIRRTDNLIGEAQRWLEVGNRKELFSEVDAVLSALVKFKSLQERSHDLQGKIDSLTARLQRQEEAMRDEGRKDALVEHGLTRKINELESQLDFYRQHFPSMRELARENHPRVNSPSSEDRANGGHNPNNQGNPLPLPPRPIWHPFTSRNPNYAPTGDSQEPYLRTSIPPVPYARQTGAGAVYYEGASYEDRVVPPAVRDMVSRDAPPERGRARSQSGHRDRSAEGRSRRRDGESDRARRRRDRHRRDTLDDADESTIPPGEPPLTGNALGIHPVSLRPGLGQYSSAAPPVTSTPNPSTSRVGGASTSRPPTSHGMAPPIATASSVPGSTYREAPQNNGTDPYYPRRADTISRPSSTPIGPVLSSWVAPDLANPSLNSLGLSAPAQDVGRSNPQTGRASSASIPLTTRDSVSSWGTADSTPGQNDVFSTLRPLASAPADSDHSHSDIFPRSDGQLLGTGRSGPIVTPQPQFPQVFIPQTFHGPPERDSDNRPYSAYGYHPRSQSQTSLPSVRDSSQPPVPPPFTPMDRGFPYASVPPMPPYSMVTPAPRPSSSHSFPMPFIPPLPHISAPPVNTATRPPNNASQVSLPGASVSSSQNTSYRSHH